MSGALRAGLVGLGAMGGNHARVLRSLPDVELVAAADPAGDPRRVLGPVPCVDNVESLVQRGIDACVVAAPTAHHLDLALTLAEAGVHVLIEKPLAHDVVSARRIREVFDERGLVCAVGHIERYNPAIRELRRRLDGGQLGALYQIATRRQSPFPGRISDVGVVFDLATHDLDLTTWVARSPLVEVSARTAHRSGRAHEDLVVAVGVLEDGTITDHLVNWLSPMKERTTAVTGEKGRLLADTLAADLTFHQNGEVDLEWEAMALFRGVSEGDMTRYAIAKPEPLRTELEAFVHAVRTGDTEGIVTAEQGLQVVRTAVAVLRSAKTGRTVPVADVEG